MAQIRETDFYRHDFGTLRSGKNEALAQGRNISQIVIANATILLVSAAAIVVFHILSADSVAMLGDASLIGLAIGGIWYLSTVIRCLLNASCVVENALSGLATIAFSLITDQTYAAGVLFVIGISHFLLASFEYTQIFRNSSVQRV